MQVGLVIVPRRIPLAEAPAANALRVEEPIEASCVMLRAKEQHAGLGSSIY